MYIQKRVGLLEKKTFYFKIGYYLMKYERTCTTDLVWLTSYMFTSEMYM